MAIIIDIVVWLKIQLVGLTSWRNLIKSTHQPRQVQLALLKSILHRNVETSFGKEHNFKSISNFQLYTKMVAQQDYESLRPYIDKQEQEQTSELNHANPVFYAQTSGTTGKPKLIPILKHTIKRYKLSQSLVSYANYHACPGIFGGNILAISSPSIEGRLESGTAYGSMSGLIYQSMPRMIRSKYVLPAIVFDVEDYKIKYYLISAFALSDSNISLIATANPSTVIKILQTINEYKQQLIVDIMSGELSNLFGMDSAKWREINDYFHQNIARGEQLKELSKQTDKITIEQLWPNLKALALWTGGSVGALLPEITGNIPKTTSLIELGYLASELRGSINIDPNKGYCIPTIYENFYEFIALDDIDNKQPKTLLIDELELGKKYYVLVTTQEGLYRYFMNDIVEVNGFFNKTPSIQFVQKGKGVVNLTGEKLYEGQVISAINKLKTMLQLAFDFFILLGDEKEQNYKLFIATEYADTQQLTNCFEDILGQLNIEFYNKRASDRLKPTQVFYVANSTYDAYKMHCIGKGQRESQFKYLVLQEEKDCSFDFSTYILES